MHELSLSESIVKAALAVRGVRSDNLRALNVRVGALSGASTAALASCLSAVLEGNNIRNVKVNIVETPAIMRCRCGRQYETKSLWDGCPACGGFEREMLEGADVTLDSVEVEDGED
jgi:hydrogenase nickel incorporation protein HypA/HybF